MSPDTVGGKFEPPAASWYKKISLKGESIPLEYYYFCNISLSLIDVSGKDGPGKISNYFFN
jgi:hypothetical protein